MSRWWLWIPEELWNPTLLHIPLSESSSSSSSLPPSSPYIHHSPFQKHKKSYIIEWKCVTKIWLDCSIAGDTWWHLSWLYPFYIFFARCAMTFSCRVKAARIRLYAKPIICLVYRSWDNNPGILNSIHLR